MRHQQINKNLPPQVNMRKNQQDEAKQTKKKACTIKLEVNKLLKPQMAKQNFHKGNTIKNAHSEVVNQHRKSIQKQIGTKNEKRVIKSFEQLYFQKMKERKLQEHAFNPFSDSQVQKILIQKSRPNSCKNIVSLKSKNQQFFHSYESAKNVQKEDNKQNVFRNKKQENDEKKTQERFLKKSQIFVTEQVGHLKKMSQSVQKVPQKIQQKDQADQEQKCKKILRIKRVSKNPNQNAIKVQQPNFVSPSFDQKKQNELPVDLCQISMKNEKSFKHELNSLCSPVGLGLNPSAQLKKFNLSTPSSSGSNKPSISSTQTRFDDIIHTKINHSSHQHIWDGIECFFSFNQFQFILQQLGFQDTIQSKQIQFYLHKLWQHLGGDIYGGVVRKNLRQFLNIVLEDDQDINNQIAQALTSKEELSLQQNFIDKATLKLLNLDKNKKYQIRKFYFPFRITKIAAQIHNQHMNENSDRKLNNSLSSHQSFSQKSQKKLSSEKQNSFRSNIHQPKEICLQNNAYLETVSVKNRNQDLSPCMIPRVSDPTKDMNLVTDFSPKMPVQKYEQFKSKILSKDDFINEKLSTEQQEDQETVKKPQNKPLLSVDVNLGEGILEKLLVYEGENPYEISVRLKERYNIDEQLREKFEKMLRNHLNTLLFKIQQVSEELFEDSVELKEQDHLRDFLLMEKK